MTIASVDPVSSAHPLQQGTPAQLTISALYGQVSTADTTVIFTLNGSEAGSAQVTAQKTVAGQGGANKAVLTFTVPQLSATSPTKFDISVSGKTTRGGSIRTQSPLSATIYPPATISSITPATVHAGLQATITIQAAYANFAQGATKASFGDGISVGGGASGATGPVTVSGPGTATASISVDPSAATGTRTVTVTTDDQTATAQNALTVQTAIFPPVPNPGGPYTGFAGQAVTFNGSASSDPNGLTLTYAWNFGDGSTSPEVNPAHTYSKAGTYTVKLIVTDTAGLSNTASTTATIGTLAPPVPSIGGPYTGKTGQSISFDASGSTDPNKSTLTYNWSFGDGAQGNGVQVTHSYSKAGAYTVTLTVTDTYNQTAKATTTATITNQAQSPVASTGGPYTGFADQAIAFNGSGSTDPNGLPLTYAWDFGDGSTATQASPTHTYANAGVYTVKLTVSDSSGLTGSANTTATITTLGAPVPSTGGPYTGKTGQSITFDASASTDPNKSALTYSWNFGDGSQGSGVKPTHSYSKAGTYTITLTLADTYNQTATATTTATITNPSEPPVANPGGPYTGIAGQPIAFNGSGSTDPNGLTLTYAWDFGDGSTSTQAAPSHTYASAGTYTVKLTVSDSTGLSGSASTTATVTVPTALTANAGGPYTGVIGAAVSFNGSGSYDPKHESLTYSWDFGDGAKGSGVSPTHVYTQTGTFTVTLTVTNTDNATASATTTVTISEALAAVLNGPYSGNVNQVLSFNGQSSTAPANDTLTYAWNFGDGATATGSPVTHAYTKAGTYTVKLTVTDTATSATASATANAVITQPIAVTIDLPTQGALFNTTTVKVTGTVSEQGASVQVNGVAANVSGGSYTASNVPIREGVNIITATATDAQGHSGTASTSVTVDMTPPTVSVFLPKEGSTVITQQIAIAGMVTDIVTGTVSANDVTITVNGQAATVANRSFQLPSFLLVPGPNILNVVAKDKAGNQSTSVVHVTLASVAAQQHAVILSGDQQTGVINSVLPQPLVAELVDANGAPVPNRAITFTVIASDGIIKSLPQQSQTLTLVTDVNGKASVLFQLGSRAGLGINQVAVTSPGFLGQAVFSESTTAGPPAFIHEFMGNNQRGLLGQPLAEAFQTIVQDAGGNPLANVPVTFTVTGGDGTFAGQTTSTMDTNADGRAIATLTLGQQEGIKNYTVNADFAGDPNSPVVFYASGYPQGDPGSTQISGIVLDNAGTPVPNATVSLQNTNLRTTTDTNGHFSISPAPLGTVTLMVDGSTTTLAETLPTLTFVLQSLPGQNNTLNMPVYLPMIDTGNAQTVGGSQPVTLTMTNLPGVALTIAPNSVTFPDGTHIGQMSLSQVKSDLVPMPPPNGIQPDFAWTLQPAGTKFSVPAQITIPNTKGLPPGQVQEFYQYDHDLEQFVSVGTLRVSPDGSVLTSDPGFGVTKAGWSSPGSNPPPPSCTNSCDDNNVCTKDSRGPNCSCIHTNVSGGCGNNPPAGKNNCQLPGMCKNGVCTGGNKPVGSTCDDGKKCTDPDTCGFDGACRGIPKPDMQQPFISGGGISVPLQNVLNLFPKILQEYLGSQGSKFNATVSTDGTFKQVCCENPSSSKVAAGSYVDDHQTTASVNFSLQLVKVPVDINGVTYAKIPCPSPYWTCGDLGITANMGLGVSGKFQVDDAQCKDLLCATGTLSVTTDITLFAGADVKDLSQRTLFKLGAQAGWGLTSSIGTSGDCKSIKYSIGVKALSFTFVATSDLGASATFPVWTLFPGATLYDGSFPVTSH